MSWTPEQISEKQKSLIQNIQRLGDVEALELTDFRQQDGLIHPLVSTDSSEASNLMCGLAIQGDDRATETLSELDL